MSLPEIDIIGTGNLATNLAPALEQNGYVINNVYGRSAKAARALAENLYQATAVTSLDFSNSRSTVFFLAVADDAIEAVSRELVLPDNAIVAHTSGSQSLSVLGYTASPNTGVFYPVQAFNKAKRTSFAGVPILVEGENRLTEKVLGKIAKALSKNVVHASSARRRMIHLATIFAGSFTNHMLAQAGELMHLAKGDINWLAPLIEESLNKSMALGPEAAQTGPAAAGDLELLDQHLEMLENFPQHQETYRLISQQILDQYQDEG